MLYMQGQQGDTGKPLRIVVLEASNIEEIKKGRPAVSDDGEVVIAYTPDMKWLTEQIKVSGGDSTKIGHAIQESLKRPETGPQPHFEPEVVRFTTDDQGG